MGKPKIRPQQNQNPWSDWNKNWHGWLRRRDDPSCKISCKSAQGGASRQMSEIYAKIFVGIYRLYTFFSETHLQVRPFGGFLRAMAQTTRSRVRMCLLKIKKNENNI